MTRACRRRGRLVVQSFQHRSDVGLWTLAGRPRYNKTQGMTTHSSSRPHMPGWPESRVGRRAITFAGLCVAGGVLLVLSFALGVVEPAQSYTDSWAQLVWGLGIWVCGVTAVVTGLIAIIRHHERSWMVVLATALGLLPLALLLSEIATGNF